MLRRSEIRQQLDRIDSRLASIETLLGEKIMPLEVRTLSALSDLQAADTALQQEVATFLADIATRLQDSPDPAAVEQVVTDIKNQVAALQQGDPANQAPPAPSGP